MRVDLASIADFHRLAVPAYAELIHSPGTGRPRLEIVLAPGTYAGSGLTLGQPITGKAIDVIIRGADPTRPAVLSDMSLAVHSRELRLHDLVFDSNGRGLPLLHAAVQSALEIRGCAFVANQTSERAGGRLLQLAVGDVEPPATVRVSIRRSWFIRNRAPDQTTLVAFDARPPLSFTRVVFDEVAFIDNAAGCCIAAGLTDLLEISRCVAYAPAAPDPQRLFAAVNFTHTRVELKQSLITGFAPHSVVSRWSASHPDAGDFQPLGIHESELIEAPTHLPDTVVEAWLDVARRGQAPDRQALAAAEV